MLTEAIERVTIKSFPSKRAARWNEYAVKYRLRSVKKFYEETRKFLSKYNFKPVYEKNNIGLHSVYKFKNFLIKFGIMYEKAGCCDFHDYARIIFIYHDKYGNYEYEQILDADLNRKNSDNNRYLEISHDKYFRFFEALEKTNVYE